MLLSTGSNNKCRVRQQQSTLTSAMKIRTQLEPFSDAALRMVWESFPDFLHTDLFRIVLTLRKHSVDVNLDDKTEAITQY